MTLSIVPSPGAFRIETTKTAIAYLNFGHKLLKGVVRAINFCFYNGLSNFDREGCDQTARVLTFWKNLCLLDRFSHTTVQIKGACDGVIKFHIGSTYLFIYLFSAFIIVLNMEKRRINVVGTSWKRFIWRIVNVLSPKILSVLARYHVKMTCALFHD